MKRIIREVVTIIKIERWLVEEDAPSLAETDGLPPTPMSLELLPDPPLDPELLAAIDEHAANTPRPNGAKIVRVLSQRVIDSTQYRVK